MQRWISQHAWRLITELNVAQNVVCTLHEIKKTPQWLLFTGLGGRSQSKLLSKSLLPSWIKPECFCLHDP